MYHLPFNEKEKVSAFYDTTAQVYAEKFLSELDDKPFDREILTVFIKNNIDKGPMIDLGCGPGQTTRFLSEQGVKDLTGIDLSNEMIVQAKLHNPNIQFRTGDMMNMDLPENSVGSIIAFYAIVHFDDDQLMMFFKEAYRTLKAGGQLLISYHEGSGIKTVDEFLGMKASADFYFHQTNKMEDLLKQTGFKNVVTTIRDPYPQEYPSQRAYVIAVK